MHTIDIVEADAHLRFLGAHLLGEADKAEPAEFVHRGAGRDGIGHAALRLDIVQRALPALTDADIKTLVHQLDLGAHHPAHQDVADAVIDRIGERYPALLNQAAFHAELGGDGRDLASMVGLHPADGDQRIGAGGNRVGDDIFELADLVAAESQPRIAVLALGIDLDAAAKMRGKAAQLLDRRRTEGQRVALEFCQHGRMLLGRV